jgi:hypothetical protein
MQQVLSEINHLDVWDKRAFGPFCPWTGGAP